MTGSKNNLEGHSDNISEPSSGPYWKRMHCDWCFWLSAVFMFVAQSICVLSGDLS